MSRIDQRQSSIRRPRDNEAGNRGSPSPVAADEPAATQSAAPEAASPPAAPPAPAAAPAPVAQGNLDMSGLLAELDALGRDGLGALLTGQRARRVRNGESVTGTVVRVGHDSVFVDIGAKSEATIELSELGGSTPRLGETISAYVLSTGEGGIRLARQLSGKAGRGAVEDAHEAGIPVEGRVEARNSGGFTVRVAGASAFCPVSQIARTPAEDLDSYVGQTMNFLVSDVRGRDVVVSHRAVEERELKEKAGQIWETIQPGDTFDGVVTSSREFGVFVDIGGVDGLVHKSELGWDRDAPVPSRGARVRVKVIEVDRAGKKLSLSMKDEGVSPWSRVGADFVEGEVYPGKVTRLAPFGAFVSLAPGLDGMVHVSNLSTERVEKPEDVVSVGQAVRVRILSVDHERRRLELGIKQADEGWTVPAAQPRKAGGGGGGGGGGSLGTMAELLAGVKVGRR